MLYCVMQWSIFFLLYILYSFILHYSMLISNT